MYVFCCMPWIKENIKYTDIAVYLLEVQQIIQRSKESKMEFLYWGEKIQNLLSINETNI